jgi:hypothetical protein
VAIVALADGAGTARFAEVGARLAIEAVVRRLKRQFRTLLRMADHDAKHILIDAIRQRFAVQADSDGAAPSDYACTLLFAATDGRQWLLGQIGDGRIGVQTRGGAWRALPLSTRGEFHNETVFVTSSNALDAFQMMRVADETFAACILMSDGAEEALFQRASGSFAPAVSSMVNWVGTYPQGMVQHALAKNLRELIRKKTQDDVSVAILRVDLC